MDAGPPGIDGTLPATIANALATASEEISEGERWVPRRRSDMIVSIPRLMAIIMASRTRIEPGSTSSKIIRQTCLKLIAYLPADLRLVSMMELSLRNPMALDDLMTGTVGPQYEVYRYNLLTSLGIFARHGLVEEVFTKDRVARVSRVVDRARRNTGSKGSE